MVRRKKEVVVRVSLGESAGFIAFKAALFDVTFDIALFIVAKILLSNYISGAYENRLVTILYSIGIILSTIPYCSFCFFDIRKAFANATHKRGVDFLIYSLKFIAGVAAVFTITTNISSIHNNLFTNEHLLEEYYDANYFTVKTTDFNAEKEEAFWNKLYKNEYNTLKPVICLNILNDKNDVIYVNNHAKDMLQGFTKQINAVENESSDLIIFIPKNRYFAKNKQLAYDSLSHVLNHDNLQQLNIQYIEYSETEYFSYLDTSRINGIEKSKNPIIIYQANKDLAVNGGYLESYKAGAVLFQCDEKQLRNISKKYEDMLGNYQLVITNVHEQYLYNHTFLIKLVGFLSSLCTIVLLLNIMIIVTVSRLEFRENAMKISLMKIFGYSLFEVATGSMSPTIKVGDVVITKLTKEVKENDIIVYIDGNNIITHRLIEKNGNKIITRGDANNSEDKPIEEKMIIGEVVKIIPQLGTWQQILSSPEILVLIVILILILSVIYAYTSKSEEKNDK